MSELKKCKCGAEARIRAKGNTVWVECRKKCGMHSGFCYWEPDGNIITRSTAEIAATILWNRKVEKDS